MSTVIVTFAIVVLLIFVFVANFCPTVLNLFGRCEKYARVVGIGRVSSAPDRASVSVGLRSENIDAKQLPAARASHAAKFNQIVDNLRQTAPEARIETRSFSVTPNYDGESGALKNYSIYSNADVEVTGTENITNLSQIVQSSVSSGSNSVGNVNYSLSDAARDTATVAAQKQAMAHALTKASDLAGHAGRRLGVVRKIVEDGLQQQQRVRFADLSSFETVRQSSASETATKLLPPLEIDVTTRVEVEYELN